MSRSRLVLAIDCATLPASVACVAGDGVRAELAHDDRRRSDAWIGTAIERCLRRADARLGDIDGLAVAVGPGTFTGIRVGIATALGLAAPRGLPVAGVSTLEALGAIGLRRAERVVACIDARRDQVYAAFYEQQRANAGAAAPAWGPAVCSAHDVGAALARWARPADSSHAEAEGRGRILAVGSGAPLLDRRDDLETDGEPVPLAAAVGRRALEDWPAGRDEPGRWRPAEPLYLRPPDAKPPRNPLLPEPD